MADRLHLPASVSASGLGAMVAGFFAEATAEVRPPGSVEWLLKDGMQASVSDYR